jgi:Na+/proline symporter
MLERSKKLIEDKLPQMKISQNVIITALIVFIIFVAGGGVYDLVNQPSAIDQNPNTGASSAVAFYGEQTLSESVFSMIVLSMTFGGLYLANRSMQVAYNRNTANQQLGIGIVFIIIGLVLSYYLIYVRNVVNG